MPRRNHLRVRDSSCLYRLHKSRADAEKNFKIIRDSAKSLVSCKHVELQNAGVGVSAISIPMRRRLQFYFDGLLVFRELVILAKRSPAVLHHLDQHANPWNILDLRDSFQIRLQIELNFLRRK